MNKLRWIMLASVVAGSLGLVVVRGEETPATGQKLITIGKSTTYIDGPLDEDGYIDYVTAVNALLSKGVTAENNAAVLIFRVFGAREVHPKMVDEFFRRMHMPVPAEDDEYYTNYYEFVKEELEAAGDDLSREEIDRQALAAQEKEYSEALEGPWTEKDYPRLARWLKRNERFCQLAHEASRRTHFYMPYLTSEQGEGPQLIAVLLPGAQHVRELARLLCVRGHGRIAAGKSPEAVQDFLALQRLGRLASRGGTLVEGLVGIAIDGIAAAGITTVVEKGDLSEQELRSLQVELSKVPRTASMIQKIDVVERYMFLDTTQSISRVGMRAFRDLYSLTGNSNPAHGALEGLAGSLVDWDSVMKIANAWYDRMAEVGEMETLAERQKAMQKVDADMEKMTEELGSAKSLARQVLLSGKSIRQLASERMAGVLVSLLLPAVSMAVEAEDKANMKSEMTQVVVAAARFKEDRGHYPDRLEELKPEFITRVPVDIYSLKPVQYKKLKNGFRVYSVGRNRVDDGGKSHADNSGGDDEVLKVAPKTGEK